MIDQNSYNQIREAFFKIVAKKNSTKITFASRISMIDDQNAIDKTALDSNFKAD